MKAEVLKKSTICSKHCQYHCLPFMVHFEIFFFKVDAISGYLRQNDNSMGKGYNFQILIHVLYMPYPVVYVIMSVFVFFFMLALSLSNIEDI